VIDARFTVEQKRNMNCVVTSGALAEIECWGDAGLPFASPGAAWGAGTVFGTGLGVADTVGDQLAPLTRVTAGNPESVHQCIRAALAILA